MQSLEKIIKNPNFWVILFLVSLGMFAFFFLTRNDRNVGFLLVSNIDVIQCDKKLNCQRTKEEEVLKEQHLSNYFVYQKNSYLGECTLDYINHWNFYDEKKEWVNLESSFLAGSKNTSLKIKDFTLRNMMVEEVKEVDKILQTNRIYSYSKLSTNEVLEYDFDKNGKNEKIILASNVTDETEDEKLFFAVIGVVNNTYTILHLDVARQYENYRVPSYNFKNIVNLFALKEDLIILTKGYFSEAGKPSSYMYQVKNKKFNILIKE